MDGPYLKFNSTKKKKLIKNWRNVNTDRISDVRETLLFQQWQCMALHFYKELSFSDTYRNFTDEMIYVYICFKIIGKELGGMDETRLAMC